MVLPLSTTHLQLFPHSEQGKRLIPHLFLFLELEENCQNNPYLTTTLNKSSKITNPLKHHTHPEPQSTAPEKSLSFQWTIQQPTLDILFNIKSISSIQIESEFPLSSWVRSPRNVSQWRAGQHPDSSNKTLFCCARIYVPRAVSWSGVDSLK